MAGDASHKGKAPGRVFVRLEVGGMTHLDELCTQCWCTTVWRVELVTLRDTGVTSWGTWTGCIDCRVPFRVPQTGQP